MTQPRSWRRDPAFHFLLGGAALALLQMLTGPTSPERAIFVSDEVVRGLRADFIRRTGSVPTAEQEEALVSDYVRNEMLYREALALGLDRGDVVVRRRLIQKMHFLLEDEKPLRQPSDADLLAYLARHSARYTLPAKVAISHVFVSSDRHPDAHELASRLHESLLKGQPAAELGDPFLRGREFPLSTEATLAGIFGAELAATVMSLPVGEWSGPIRSSYGEHLVLVRESQPARVPSVSDVRARLIRDWRSEQREKLNREAIEELRDAYDVRVEKAGAA